MQDKETVKIDMSNSNSDIYDRQKRIHDFDQSALSQGNVLIIGAGALGNECTKNLCQAGIGRMTLVDFDNIEVSNLNRCVWYTHDDIGSPKAIVLKDKLSSQFTDISINAITQRFEDMDEQLLIDADVVVSCVDSMDTRLTINSYCMDFSIPLVDGGTEAFSGRVQTVIPGTTPCLECGRRDVKQKIMNARYRCGELVDVFERSTAAISTCPTAASSILRASSTGI